MARRHVFLILALLALPAACRREDAESRALAEAFAAPATLSLRKDLPLQSEVVATAKHGDRLEVLQVRRRFVQVRTAAGVEGWTDGRLLLTSAQMAEIKSFATGVSGLPSQGSATVYEALNVHTEPNRTSPSFMQIPEGGKVEVIGHVLSVRNSGAPTAATFSLPRPRPAKKAQEKLDTKRVAPPPMPAPPKLPSNWQQLSRPTLADVAAHAPANDSKQAAAKPPVLEDWSLIRTSDGAAGWVLSRMVTMSIPDEVAQYANGHRITSYFPLSDVRDSDGQLRHAWLWTTISHGGLPYEFDGFRVFVWNTRRNRYETVYRKHDLKGHYPVAAAKGSGPRGEGAEFTVLVEDDEGNRSRDTYTFNGYRVSLTRSEPYVQGGAADVTVNKGSAAQTGGANEPWYRRWSDRVRSLFRR